MRRVPWVLALNRVAVWIIKRIVTNSAGFETSGSNSINVMVWESRFTSKQILRYETMSCARSDKLSHDVHTLYLEGKRYGTYKLYDNH